MGVAGTKLTLAVIILNWNCADDTAGVVANLPASWRDRIIVVDNGSDDEAKERFILDHLGVRVIYRHDNGGYAAGMNTGMRAAFEAGFSHAVLVNADARPDAPTFERLFDIAADTAAALVGTAQTGPDGKRYVTAAVGHGNRHVDLFPREFTCPGCEDGTHEVDVVSGATILVNLDDLNRVGYMDESFFHYAEEIDMCIRVAESTGQKAVWSCRTEVPHRVGGSMPHTSARSHYYRARNKALLVRKHAANTWWASPRLVKEEGTFLLWAIRDGATGAWASGVRDGMTGRSGRVR